MSTFIVRIELHPSDQQQAYSRVHDAMARAGFSRTYKGSDNVSYHLPTSEYCFTSNSPVEVVRDSVAAATSTVTTNFMLLVSETTRIATAGLIPLKEAGAAPAVKPAPAAPKAT